MSMVKSVWLRVLLMSAMLLLATGGAEAQWVLLGRKAIGAVRSVSQPHDGTRPGYDVATVVLNADAEKVYRTVVDRLQNNPQITVSGRNDASLSVNFHDAQRQGEIQVTPLKKGYSELLVASSGAPPGTPSGTSLVVEGILRVCDQLKVKCSLAQP